ERRHDDLQWRGYYKNPGGSRGQPCRGGRQWCRTISAALPVVLGEDDVVSFSELVHAVGAAGVDGPALLAAARGAVEDEVSPGVAEPAAPAVGADAAELLGTEDAGSRVHGDHVAASREVDMTGEAFAQDREAGEEAKRAQVGRDLSVHVGCDHDVASG